LRIVAVLGALAAPVLAGTLYVWSGDSASNGNRTDDTNWLGSGYPGEGGTTADSVILDDPSPRPEMIQDTGVLTIQTLFVGDGHTIRLDYDIIVTTAADGGMLEFEGQPPADGTTVYSSTANRKIQAQYVIVNTGMETVITTDGNTRITTVD